MTKIYQLPFIALTIKAELNKGVREWVSSASTTTPDSLQERTSLMLFQDWIARIKSNVTENFLPNPKLPYLSIAHYPDLQGFGVAGVTDAMQIKSVGDGDFEFVVRGVWDDGSMGRASYEAVLNDMLKIEKGSYDDDFQPIRISAAWWDIEHSHGDYVFKRSSLGQQCPVCKAGLTKNKQYMKGQAEHWALTRIPIHKQTSIKIA